MNTCSISGELVRNAVCHGTNDKAMAFTVAAKYGYNAEEKKDRISFVPCVVFNPDHELVTLLTEKGKGVHLEFEGRVNSSKYDVEGQTRYKTEVVVRNGTIQVKHPKN